MKTARLASQCAIKGVNPTSLAGMRDSSGGSERSGLKTRTLEANSADSGDAHIKRLWYEPETLATDSEARTVATSGHLATLHACAPCGAGTPTRCHARKAAAP